VPPWPSLEEASDHVLLVIDFSNFRFFLDGSSRFEVNSVDKAAILAAFLALALAFRLALKAALGYNQDS
jgi:hypothetical protein